MTFDLYGIVCGDIEQARETLEAALGMAFTPHESSYHGGDYYRYQGADAENFILQRNFDAYDDAWTEDANQNKPYLLYVNRSPRSEQLRERLMGLPGVELLRQTEI